MNCFILILKFIIILISFPKYCEILTTNIRHVITFIDVYKMKFEKINYNFNIWGLKSLDFNCYRSLGNYELIMLKLEGICKLINSQCWILYLKIQNPKRSKPCRCKSKTFQPLYFFESRFQSKFLWLLFQKSIEPQRFLSIPQITFQLPQLKRQWIFYRSCPYGCKMDTCNSYFFLFRLQIFLDFISPFLSWLHFILVMLPQNLPIVTKETLYVSI